MMEAKAKETDTQAQAISQISLTNLQLFFICAAWVAAELKRVY
jgi:hypothetical protein